MSRPFLDRYFKLSEHHTTVRTEILAGLVTFVTMAYIIVVNPAILEAAGIPFGPSMVATILSAAFGTLVMGLYAKRPFAIAPYMGENAFVAYTVVLVLGYSWQTALGAVFIGGVLFVILTLSGARATMSRAIP
jgi:AGZA family xanthine/uracil permease-like MFS transporter